MFYIVYLKVLFKGNKKIDLNSSFVMILICLLFLKRRGHDILQSELPPKTEYVILLKLSTMQKQLYMKFLETIGAFSNTTEKTLNPLRAFAICCKVNNFRLLFCFYLVY